MNINVVDRLAEQPYMYVDDSKVTEHYKCPICTLPLFDPVTSNCHQFCRACIEQHVNGDPDALCPIDRQPLGSLTDVSGPVARPMLQVLSAIEVYCPHRRGDQGCQASLNMHILSCANNFKKTPLPYLFIMLSNVDCLIDCSISARAVQATIQRGNVNDHTRSCPHKQCPHAISGCAFTGTPSLVAQHEAAECEWRAVACPESGCGARVSARELVRHICRQCTHREAGCRFQGGSPTLVARHEAAECEWRSLACPEPGCGARVAARDLEAHRASHALQQGAEQLARRPDRQPRQGQAAAVDASAADRPPGLGADEEEKAWVPAVESGEAEAALERMLALQ